MEADIIFYDEVDSTNPVLSEMADAGAKEGTCVVALSQRSGRGRSGRSFYSPGGGNLYMSLLLRPADDAAFDMITVAAAVATVEAIKERYGIDTGIKWVNDIICRGKKVSGILAVSGGHLSGDPYVILGIGINIYRSETVPGDIKDVYGSLFDDTCKATEEEVRKDVISLAEIIISHFSGFYEKCDTGVYGLYRKYSTVIGKTVSYLSGGSTFSAVVADIDGKGGIVLEHEGRLNTYRDGEIRIRPEDM